MKDISELKAALERHKGELRERYRVKEIGIFGSYVRGEAEKESDLDILVEFEEAPGLLGFIELEEYLSEILGVEVDLVRKKSIRKELKDDILREAIMI